MPEEAIERAVNRVFSFKPAGHHSSSSTYSGRSTSRRPITVTSARMIRTSPGSRSNQAENLKKGRQITYFTHEHKLLSRKLRLTTIRFADHYPGRLGPQEIAIAEKEMPGLMAIREKYAPGKPLQGVARDRLAAHDDPDRGSDRDPGRSRRQMSAGRAAISSPLRITRRPRSPRRACRFSPGRVRALEEYWWCTHQAISFPGGKGPQLVVDDGGDVTLLIHKGYQLEEGSDWAKSPSQSKEEQVHQETCSSKCSARIRSAGMSW